MLYGKFGAGDGKYLWTAHARVKMRQYGLSEGRIKRIVRFPVRYEEGIAPETVAVMQPAGSKRYQEIWAMYKLAKRGNAKSIKIITAWRYPGKSPLRNPVPIEVMDEVKKNSMRIGIATEGGGRGGTGNESLLVSETTEQSEGQKPRVSEERSDWWYPGKSPVRDPIPQEVLREIKQLL